jgi:hypothetical protein
MLYVHMRAHLRIFGEASCKADVAGPRRVAVPALQTCSSIHDRSCFYAVYSGTVVSLAKGQQA